MKKYIRVIVACVLTLTFIFWLGGCDLFSEKQKDATYADETSDTTSYSEHTTEATMQGTTEGPPSNDSTTEKNNAEIVPGDEKNIKVTTPLDLKIAELFLEGKA